MKRLLQIILVMSGIVGIGIALIHIALGPTSIPGSIAVNPTMDSEDRFYAVMFLGHSVALLWCAQAVERRSYVVRFLAGLLFLGGVARLISMIAVGPPNLFFQAMTAIELSLPIVLWVMVKRVENSGV